MSRPPTTAEVVPQCYCSPVANFSKQATTQTRREYFPLVYYRTTPRILDSVTDPPSTVYFPSRHLYPTKCFLKRGANDETLDDKRNSNIIDVHRKTRTQLVQLAEMGGNRSTNCIIKQIDSL